MVMVMMRVMMMVIMMWWWWWWCDCTCSNPRKATPRYLCWLPQPKTNSDEEFKNSEKAETTNFETQNEKINFPRENSNDGGQGESTSTAKTTTTDSFDGTRSSGIKVSDGGDDAAEVVAVAPFAGMEMLKDEIPRKNDGAGSRVNVTATTLNNFGQRKKGQPHIARSNRDSIPRYHPFLMHISALIIFSAAHSKDSTVNIYWWIVCLHLWVCKQKNILISVIKWDTTVRFSNYLGR